MSANTGLGMGSRMPRSPRRQSGMSFWGLLYVLATLGFIVMLGVKCVPIYINEMSVARAVHDVAGKNASPTGEVDVAAIRGDLQKRWDVDYINRIEAREVKVVRSASGMTLSYDYEAREHLFYNIFIVLHFAEDVPIRTGGG